MLRHALLAASILVAVLACESSPAAIATTERADIEIRQVGSGRARCALSFVESATGAVDPSGRFIALPGFCQHTSRFGDFVVEVIDLQRERSVQLYDFEGEGEGYPFFTNEGYLVALSQISQARSPDDLTQVPSLRYHIWGGDYSDAPRIFDTLIDDDQIGGSPRRIALDPLEPRIALFWREGRYNGAIQLVSLAGGRPEQTRLLNNDTLSWVADEPSSFDIVSGIWVDRATIMANRKLYLNQGDRGLQSGDPQLGWVLLNPDTGALLSRRDNDQPARVVSYPDHFDTYLGDVERRLPNGILVVRGENTGPASQRYPASEYELALRRSEDFELIGGVPAFVANRQLAGYDFSDDGEHVFLLKRDGNLEIRATRTWQLDASIPVSRYIRRGASEVIAIPRSNRVVLVGGRRWIVLDTGLELNTGSN